MVLGILSADANAQRATASPADLSVASPPAQKLVVSFVGLPSLDFSFDSSATGFVLARSVGEATDELSTVTVIRGWPSAAPDYLTVPPRLLAAGQLREMPVQVESWLGIGRYTIRTTLLSTQSGRAAGEVSLSRTVLIINPLWLLVVVGMAVLPVWGIRRRRKRRLSAARRTPAPEPYRRQMSTRAGSRSIRMHTIRLGR